MAVSEGKLAAPTHSAAGSRANFCPQTRRASACSAAARQVVVVYSYFRDKLRLCQRQAADRPSVALADRQHRHEHQQGERREEVSVRRELARRGRYVYVRDRALDRRSADH